ncbi:uncharacterized protein LOC119992693 [Tripterygium wilfordii]|uniref:uncharacterized protein LOC119992693 n=1 Tax=Tripterygium wilfordii TaxID=458696 RepID=UPI0018F83CF0|nr:uncharacterized protein LOC119992693 [Tripterygium wilfordii]
MAPKVLLLILLNTFLSSGIIFYPAKAQSWIKAGYWFYNSGLPVSDINSALYTHIICAFADLNSCSYELSVPHVKSFSNFANVVKLKNPSITTLLSIGGENADYSDFSLMVRNSSYRASFIQSSIKLSRLYGFDGLDFDWGSANTSSNMVNMGTLFQEWRAAIASETRNSSQSELILTAAVHYTPNWHDTSFPKESARQNLNWVHVLAYDYYGTWVNSTVAFAALYDPASEISTDYGIGRWLNGGIPANKLILGLPFYGYAWTLENPSDNGVGAPATGPAITDDGSMGYKDVKNYIKRFGAKIVYNATYVVNYCTVGSTWIAFDDTEVVRIKVSYAKEKDLLGYVVWQIPYDDNWVLSQAAAQVGDKKHNDRRSLVIILTTTAALVLLLGCVAYYAKSITLNRKGKPKATAGDFGYKVPDLMIYSYDDIKAATDDFSIENKLGEGGYGPVYKGILSDGQEIAVKKLSKTSTQGFEEFKNEVTLTARLQHVNLVKVLGFCIDRDEQMLIYEYMPNKSLDRYLFDPVRRYLLDWEKRVQIIEGVTQAFLYLQEYSRFTIIHRDLKPSNILLDNEMKPKISDFGMARIFAKDGLEGNTSRIVGTFGYAPPEYIRQGLYSRKSDVYSFGILLLQLINGRRNGCSYGVNENLSLTEYAYELWLNGEGMEFMDSTLDDSGSSCKLIRCMQIDLLCVQDDPKERPSMLEVSSMLQNGTTPLAIPKKPSFSVKGDNEDQKKETALHFEMFSVDDATISTVGGREYSRVTCLSIYVSALEVNEIQQVSYCDNSLLHSKKPNRAWAFDWCYTSHIPLLMPHDLVMKFPCTRPLFVFVIMSQCPASLCFLPSMTPTALIAILTTLICISSKVNCSNSYTWIKGGYWYYTSELPVSEIDSTLFTHLTCSFAFVNSSSYQILINSSDQQSFSTFTDTVKLKNPSIFTILSIWVGEEYSPIFSSMISESSYRKSFINSSITISRLYAFRGLELHGVKPNNSTNMTNLGTLLSEWRDAIASEASSSGNSDLILAMAGYNLLEKESVSYPIESMIKNLDWTHVMAYDYYIPTTENYTGYHAALYGPSSRASANDSMMEWISRGISANKLVLGLPFHGYGWSLVNPQDNDVGVPASGPAITLDGSMGYKLIKSQIETNGYGVVSVYNSTYVVNLVKFGNNWVNFDDVEAIRAKIGYAKERRLLGYNAFQLSNDDNWVLSRVAGDIGDADHKGRRRLPIIVAASVVMAILLLGIMLCCYLQRRVFKSKGITDRLKISVSKLQGKIPATEYHEKNAPSLQAFSFAIIKAATNNFSNENKLGGGGFGPVYKGRLPRGQEIAVKRLSKTSTQGLEEFKNEVTLTARLEHVNLVRVLGFCTENDEKMLVYKYMPNKSLDFYLFDPIKRYQLDWRKRVHIIQGVTQGLLYLQEYSNFTIIHRDIKASNILLDNELNPKISDFGLARLFKKDEREANAGRIVGTYGYVPPEYVRKGIYSMKYDVYSFGVLLLQIISGKRNACIYGPYENLHLLEYAYELWIDGAGMEFIYPALDDSHSTCKLIRCMQVALLCVQENPVDRPSMLEVFSMLKNETPAVVTPKHPTFSKKNDEDEECEPILKERICSVNDMTISQDVPR